MKIHDRLNVVSLPLKERDHEKSGGRRPSGGQAKSPEILHSIREQMRQLEKAIRQTEQARTALSESAYSAAGALRKFEQTLANLSLSLENQRVAAANIDSAGHAGEAAALLKAQILGAGDLAVKSHGHTLPNQVARVLEGQELFA